MSPQREGKRGDIPLQDEDGRISEERIMEALRDARVHAPDGFALRVMKSVGRQQRTSAWSVLSGFWAAPMGKAAVVAAAAAALVLLLMFWERPTTAPDPRAPCVTATFSLRAPDAGTVELLGSFNNWERGTIMLKDSDRTGNWTATVSLPKGRHEYVFLVDGTTRMADPSVGIRRRDGFGGENTVIRM